MLASDTVLHRLEDGPPAFRPLYGREGPEYPMVLRRERVNGMVEVSFTVDTAGAIVPGSAVVEYETDRRFGDSVCAYLRRVRFTAFVADGRRYSVRVVRQPFRFEIY